MLTDKTVFGYKSSIVAASLPWCAAFVVAIDVIMTMK